MKPPCLVVLLLPGPCCSCIPCVCGQIVATHNKASIFSQRKLHHASVLGYLRASCMRPQ